MDIRCSCEGELVSKQGRFWFILMAASIAMMFVGIAILQSVALAMVLCGAIVAGLLLIATPIWFGWLD